MAMLRPIQDWFSVPSPVVSLRPLGHLHRHNLEKPKDLTRTYTAAATVVSRSCCTGIRCWPESARAFSAFCLRVLLSDLPISSAREAEMFGGVGGDVGGDDEQPFAPARAHGRCVPAPQLDL